MKSVRLATLVETWHDDAASPQLIACAPPSFMYDLTKTTRLHRRITAASACYRPYEPTLRTRRVELPVFSTFEVVAAFLHRAGFNAVFVVVVYRPGSSSVKQSFFDDFSDLLERLSTFSAPLCSNSRAS